MQHTALDSQRCVWPSVTRQKKHVCMHNGVKSFPLGYHLYNLLEMNILRPSPLSQQSSTPCHKSWHVLHMLECCTESLSSSLLAMHKSLCTLESIFHEGRTATAVALFHPLPSSFQCLVLVPVTPAVHRNNNYKGSIYMVFDYAEYDLTGLMETVKYKFSESQIKCIMKQLLKGLAYVHGNGVLHRDLK
eukprot:scaffold45538_cov19-Tisochrysis_lutea.AAC.1